MATAESHSDVVSVYRVAFWATVAMLVIIPLQIAAFALEPIPASVVDWFALFRNKPILGLFHADFFLMVNNALIALIYLAFYHSLKGTDRGLLQVGLILGFIGIAAYLSSNKTFELWSLSAAYFAAGSDAERTLLAAAGQAALSGWQGTAFDAYYVLNGIALLVVSFLMLRSPLYGRTTAAIGLASGFFMTIPSTAGAIGLVFSLLSLIPWYVFALRFARVFRKLAARAV